MKLRPYQSRAISQTFETLDRIDGNPCLVLPTGAGKSIIVAEICQRIIKQAPEMRILMLTHVKELLAQNAEKLRAIWPGAPLGIFSASLRKRELGEPITFAGIQSVRNRPSEIGHIDLVIIDECHLVSHRDEGGYRSLLAALKEINPDLRVLGLTATPWRLGHGMITENGALFDELITGASIEELIHLGFLSTLRSKHPGTTLDTSGVKKRGGDFIDSELAKSVDTDDQNARVVAETIERASERRHWLVFCVGIEHAEHVSAEFERQGISSAVLSGKCSKLERERKISEFKAGKIRALCNVNVLTTGFDFPDIDCLVMLRPTLSPVLYVQMVGRGMRLKSHTDNCLVLDFSGLVQTHGPITAVQPPKKKGAAKEGEAPVKVCPECNELLHTSALVCICGYEFPPPEKKQASLHNDDIMGMEGTEMEISEWEWRKHTSNRTGKEMLKVSYYGCNLSDPVVDEYLTVKHEGRAGAFAMNRLKTLATASGAVLASELEETAANMNKGEPPRLIEYMRNGKYFRVTRRSWEPKQMELSDVPEEMPRRRERSPSYHAGD